MSLVKISSPLGFSSAKVCVLSCHSYWHFTPSLLLQKNRKVAEFKLSTTKFTI